MFNSCYMKLAFIQTSKKNNQDILLNAEKYNNCGRRTNTIFYFHQFLATQ